MARRVVAGLLIVIVLCICIVPPSLAVRRVTRGSFYGMSWRVVDGVLFLGEENTTQMVWFNLTMTRTDWPWNEIRNEIMEIRCDGRVIVSGSIGGLAQSCRNVKIIDLSNMDVSGVVDMTGLFSGCQSLMDLNLDGWCTGKVTSMAQMFNGCSKALSFDLSMLDTSKVTTMCEMFYMCKDLTGLNLAGWDISNVENIERMFAGCPKLTEFHFNGWSALNIMKLLTEYDRDVLHGGDTQSSPAPY